MSLILNPLTPSSKPECVKMNSKPSKTSNKQLKNVRTQIPKTETDTPLSKFEWSPSLAFSILEIGSKAEPENSAVLVQILSHKGVRTTIRHRSLRSFWKSRPLATKVTSR